MMLLKQNHTASCAVNPFAINSTRNKKHVKKPLEHFQHLNELRQKNQQMTLTSMFKVQSDLNKRGLQASYELGFLLAKKSRPLTIGEELLKPAFTLYH